MKKPILFKFNLLEFQIISVVNAGLNYFITSTILYFSIPTKPQYIYHLFYNPDVDTEWLNWKFFFCAGFEIYSKFGTVQVVIQDIVQLFIVSFVVKYWFGIIRQDNFLNTFLIIYLLILLFCRFLCTGDKIFLA